MRILEGKTIVATQSEAVIDGFSSIMEDLGARVLKMPMIKIVPSFLSQPEIELLENIKDFDHIVFTSANGVLQLCALLDTLKIKKNISEEVKFSVIGYKTAEVVKQQGCTPYFVGKGRGAEDFMEELRQGLVGADERVLLAQGNLADDTLLNGLKEISEVVRMNVYQTVGIEFMDETVRNRLAANDYDLIVFSSGSAVDNFVNIYTGNIDELRIASMGKSTSRALEQHLLKPLVKAEVATNEGLVDAIVRFFEKN